MYRYEYGRCSSTSLYERWYEYVKKLVSNACVHATADRSIVHFCTMNEKCQAAERCNAYMY